MTRNRQRARRRRRLLTGLLAMAATAFVLGGPGLLAQRVGSRSQDDDRLPTPLAALADPLVNNPAMDLTTADTQGVTSIVLGSGSNAIVAFNDSGSGVGGANRLTGFSRSTNGGTTWTDGGVLPGNNDGGNPVLTRDAATGRLYLSTRYSADATGGGVQMFRSDDDGATWLPGVQAAPGAFAGDIDKQWHAVDNFPGTGQGTVYVLFRDRALFSYSPTRIYLTRSTDGGATFQPSGRVEITAGSGWVHGPRVVVGPDHSVYAFWFDVLTYPQFGIRMRRSTDQGVTFGAPVTVVSLDMGGLGLEFPTNSHVHAAVNPVSGHLYAVFNDDVAGTDRADVFLTISTDLGATWSAPVRVSTDGTTNDQFFPTLAVTPDGSKLFVTWYDRRSDPANSRIERWGRIGTISGGTLAFGTDFAVSSGSSPVDATYLGDYDQAVADDSFFYTSWSDNRLPSPNVPARPNQQDVRFAKIPVAGPGAILMLDTTAPAQMNTAACNDVSVSIRNNGTAIATGISATLTTTTPNVSVDVTSSAYPDIPVGSAATNAQPFKIRFNSGFPCGQTVSFSLAVTTATEGSFTIPFQVTTPLALGTPLNFDNNTSLPIPDFNTVESAIAVSGFTGNVGKVTASFHLTHPSDIDLRISLIGPDNTTVDLTSSNGFGANYGSACTPLTNRTTFDDAAATSITAGTPPFVGSFRPEQSLVAFDGKTGTAVNGTWRLRIVDDFVGNVGTLLCWSLTVIPTGICTVGGNCGLPPTTTADTYATAFNTPLNVAAPGVLSNDSANGGATMTAVLVSNVSQGTLALDASGSVTYTPNAGFVGSDTFTYRATNSNGPGNVATVTITVSPPPTPTSVDDVYTTAFQTALTVAGLGVLGNDTSIGGGSMTAALVSDPTNGTLSLSASGGFIYTPNACFVGTDSFSYRATNAGGAGNIATVTIAVADATSIQPPRNLVASSVVGNDVTVRFDPPCAGLAATQFTLKGGLNPGETLGALATGSPYPVYSLTAPSGAFYVRMHALDSGGAESSASNEIRLFVNVPQPPSAPTSLTGLANGSAIVLNWQNTFAGGTPASTLLDVTGSAAGTISLGTGESFSLPGVPPGTYTLQVRSSNGTGASGPSNSVTLSFPSACSGAPQAPERYLAYKVGTTLFVSWDAPSAGPAPTEYMLRATGAAVGTFTIPGRLAFATVGSGTYNLSVLARNPCGLSPETRPQAVTIP